MWKFFASVKLTIFLLLSLAVTSVIGTLIPQNENPAAYVQNYGEVFYRLFDRLGMFDMYHSWWFQMLLILLTVNITVCSIQRLSKTWKIIFPAKPSFKRSKFQKRASQAEFVVQGTLEKLRPQYDAFLKRAVGPSVVERTPKGFCVFAEKLRWTRLGVYCVHFSVILLLMGGLIGSLFGFDGAVNIAEGETANQIWIRNSHAKRTLPFAIRCDDFDVSFYDTGAPKEFRSTLTLLENGEPILTRNIIVNDPLRHEGINIFQSSYGRLAPEKPPIDPEKEITLKLVSKESGMQYERKAKLGQTLQLPEDKGELVIKTFEPAFAFGDMKLGPTFMGAITPSQGDPIRVVLPVKYARFDAMRKGALVISVVDADDAHADHNHDHEPRYYTGLQVNYDPGVWIVYLGFLIMIIGCYITFFMFHQQVCIEVIKSGSQNRVIVSGIANRNKLGMQKRIKQLAQRLQGDAGQEES